MEKRVSLCVPCALTFFTLFLPIWTPSLSLPLEDKAKICETDACKATAENLKNCIDPKVNPCDDFYLHACGNFAKSFKSVSSTRQQRDTQNQEEILDFIKKNDSDDEPKVLHEIRQLFPLCLNQDEHYDRKVIQKLFREIIGVPSTIKVSNETTLSFDYSKALARLRRKMNVDAFFTFNLMAHPFTGKGIVIVLTKAVDKYLSRKTLYSKSDPDLLYMFQTMMENELSIISQKNVNERRTIQCEKNTSLLCRFYNSQFTSFAEFLTKEMEKIHSERLKVIKKLQPKLDSTFVTTFTLQELQNMTDSIANEVNSKTHSLNWTSYIEEIFNNVEGVYLNLENPSKFEIFIFELDVVRDALKFMLTKSAEEIQYTIYFNIIEKALSYVMLPNKNSTEREKSCSKNIVYDFGAAFSYMYFTQTKHLKAATDISNMYQYIKQTFKEIIEKASWIDDQTKEKALNKLASMKSFLIRPNFIESLSDVIDEIYLFNEIDLKKSYFETMLSYLQKQIDHYLSLVNRNTDYFNENTLFTFSYMVNAFYALTKNVIGIFPALADRPFYDSDGLAAWNYGVIGFIVAHEVTHGFDNAGREFDNSGNYINWWQKDTLDKYKAKEKCLINAYSTYDVTFNNTVQKVDGKLTLGEDIADNAGFKESLFAYRKYVLQNGREHFLPQFENHTHEQLFTLAFANFFCKTQSQSDIDKVGYDKHNPNIVRVNAVLRNSDEFAEIWKCPKGSYMNPDAEKCSLW